MAIELTDDGTLDTVLRCSECGKEMRYNYDPCGPDTEPADDDQQAEANYDAFVAECIEDATADHECLTHLLLMRGGSLCGEDGPTTAEINNVTCEDCIAAHEDAEPQEGDLTTEDHEMFYQNGRLVLDGRNKTSGIYYAWIGPGKPQERMGPFETVERALRAYMDRTQFWPNVWFISDHGNAHLMDLTEDK